MQLFAFYRRRFARGQIGGKKLFTQNYFRNGRMFGPFNERWFNFMLSSLKSLFFSPSSRVLLFPCSTITYQYKFSTSNETNAFTTVYILCHSHKTKWITKSLTLIMIDGTYTCNAQWRGEYSSTHELSKKIKQQKELTI